MRVSDKALAPVGCAGVIDVIHTVLIKFIWCHHPQHKEAFVQPHHLLDKFGHGSQRGVGHRLVGVAVPGEVVLG